MHPRRFYLSAGQLTAGQNTVALVGPEARYLALVLRLRPGDSIEVFDATGNSAQACLEHVDPKQTLARLISFAEAVEEKGPALFLALALLKGKKMDLVVQKANELGAQALIPLITRFCEKRDPAESTNERWRRIALESCKQCGRSVPLEIKPASPLEQTDFSWAALKLAAWESEQEATLPGAALSQTPGPVCLLIGPEGGLHADEAAWLGKQGFQTFSLGKNILRAETAAIAGLAVCQYLIGALNPPGKRP